MLIFLKRYNVKPKHPILLFFVFFSSSLFGMTMADKEEYEKLGLSQVEWDMIQKSHMSKSMLHHLLKCGVSIPEYFKSPWKEIKISESEWLSRRCGGQSSSDIKTSEQNQQAGIGKIGTNEWAPIQSFFLPGLNQFRRHQTVKGLLMSGVALTGLSILVAQSLSANEFRPLGLFILVPDMLWSAIDIGIQIRREENPDARRFILAPRSRTTALAITLNFPLPRTDK